MFELINRAVAAGLAVDYCKTEDEERIRLKGTPISKPELVAAIEEQEQKLRPERLAQRLMHLVDNKQAEGLTAVLGYKATPRQLERYRDKYERAKAGEFDAPTNQIIIEKHQAMRAALCQQADCLELMRGFVDDLITFGELDKAEAALRALGQLQSKTSLVETQALIEGLGVI